MLTGAILLAGCTQQSDSTGQAGGVKPETYAGPGCNWVMVNNQGSESFLTATATCGKGLFLKGGGGQCFGDGLRGDNVYLNKSTPFAVSSTNPNSWYVNCVSKEGKVVNAQATALCCK